MRAPQTLVEKIVQRHAVGESAGRVVRAGEIVRIRPAHVLTHDNSSAVLEKFLAWGARRVADARQPVLALDHDIQNESASNLAKYARIEAFAREQGLAFFPKGRGIGHQVMVEEGFVRPGTLVVAADSHANLYGGFAALGTPVGRADAAALWATGTTWWEVPEVLRVRFEGALPRGATGKDVILALCSLARRDALGRVVEFEGPGTAGLSVDARLTIANMTTEWGALAGIFPFDETLREFLEQWRDGQRDGRSLVQFGARDWVGLAWRERLCADENAPIVGRITVDLSSISPFVAGPNDVSVLHSLADFASPRVPIQKAYLLSCVNARREDLEQAADVLRGRRVAPGVELYVAAASEEVEREVVLSGVWKDLLDAGGIPLPAGCGPCIGLGRGILKAGETGISATNRNFVGRMGDPNATCYLASPAVVAASAVAGHITGPGGLPTSGPPRLRIESTRVGGDRVSSSPSPRNRGALVLVGDIVLLPRDDLDTDGIWPGSLTYRDDIARDEMARNVFRNYAPDFARIARPGDVLVVGANFGLGSSREQAATALQAFGIPLVIAASASSTYKRNALNNGLAIIECPALFEAMHQRFASDPSRTPPVLRTGLPVRADLGAGSVRVEGIEFPFAPLSPMALTLLARGGLEAIVREELAAGESRS